MSSTTPAAPTILNKPMAPIGYGLMGLTWRSPATPTASAITVMHRALSLAPAGTIQHWNGGELYGPADANSLHLLAAYFAAHPADAARVSLSIKGGLSTAPGVHGPDGSDANIRRSIGESRRVLAGACDIDIFQCARVDPRVPIEAQMRTLAACVSEGLIRGIGLSEVGAATLRRAVKIHPVAAVEIELSLFATEALRNGIVAACAELGVPVIAYSPLGRGVLAGDALLKSNSELAEGDFRRALPKYQDDVLAQNLRLVAEVDKLAKRKGCTRAQVAIAWVRQMSGRVLADGTKLGVIIPIPGATTEERVVENLTSVELSEDEMREIDGIIDQNPVVGDRYAGPLMKLADA